jgi:hypothetical protein
MTNTNAVAESPTTKELKRIVPVNRKPNEIMTKIDYAGIMEAWKPITNILDRIKRNDPKNTIKVKITPEMALDILTLNDMGHNRHVVDKLVKKYTKAMQDKRWMENNGDTICISTEGKLIDGQKRLWAIWLSKQTIEFLIVTGLPPEAFAYKDIGQNRSAEDMSSINGHQKNAKPLSAAIKIIILFEKRSIVKSSISTNDVDNYEVNDWQQDASRMLWMEKTLAVIKTDWMEKNKNFFTAPQWLAIYYILKSLPNRSKDAKEFLESFIEGVNLAKTSPIRIARSYFENDMDQFTRYKKKNTVTRNILAIKYKVLFSAWDLWLAKASVSEIKIDTNNPEIKRPNWNRNAA